MSAAMRQFGQHLEKKKSKSKMGTSSKKHAKGRLDKYYHLAKDQGYRARSAFKLIQLNKKYNFLESSKCLIDLCAAPGGWCQVAVKYMPKPNLIIGLDLEKIKPIPGVITHQEDITSASCRMTLRKDLKTWKADTVLHDGAPNVGVSWIQDAFTQSELTLSACKLATEFLVPGGTFVTKVFRSKDYNKLIWVFNQLFGKVEATKPSASRTVSAEIFVVCRDYLAPKKIDPRILDPKFAFKELDDGPVPEETDTKKLKALQGAALNDLLHPEKRKRHRDGYQDGDYTLYHTITVHEFIEATTDFLSILASTNALTFDPTNKTDQTLQNSSLTTEDIKDFISDLKVLGKKEFKMVIKWRDACRALLGLNPKPAAAEPAEQAVEEMDIETLIERQKIEAAQKQRKEKKKARERKLKVVQRLRLGMETPFDVGVDASNEGLNGLPEYDMVQSSSDMDDELDATIADLKCKQMKAVQVTEEESENDSDGDSEDEVAAKLDRLDSSLDEMFKQYEHHQSLKNPARLKLAKTKSEAKVAFEEWYGIGEDASADPANPHGAKGEYDSSSSSDDSSSDEDADAALEEVDEKAQDAPLSKKARLFFDNPIFHDSALQSTTTANGWNSASDSEEEEGRKLSKKEKKAALLKKKEFVEEEKKGFQVVPAKAAVPFTGPLDEEYDDDEDAGVIDSAQAYTLAQRMITKSGKRDVIDESFNRFAFNDPNGLPTWFLQDENRHNKPSLPETKEAVQIMREKMKALDARPIKKIAEAKFRKQMRTQRRIMKAAAISQGVADQEEISEKSKLEQAAKIMTKARSKKEKEKVKLVVAKGVHKAVQGRPRGVKGRYKMVDGPMKKETRALKRVEKKKKGSGRR